jgi:hypothetical protein
MPATSADPWVDGQRDSEYPGKFRFIANLAGERTLIFCKLQKKAGSRQAPVRLLLYFQPSAIFSAFYSSKYKKTSLQNIVSTHTANILHMVNMICNPQADKSDALSRPWFALSYGMDIAHSFFCPARISGYPHRTYFYKSIVLK